MEPLDAEDSLINAEHQVALQIRCPDPWYSWFSYDRFSEVREGLHERSCDDVVLIGVMRTQEMMK
jgi:hypothetical protein